MNQRARHQRRRLAVVLVLDDDVVVVTGVDQLLDVCPKNEDGSVLLQYAALLVSLLEVRGQLDKLRNSVNDHELNATLVALRCVEARLLVVVSLNEEEGH